MGATAAPNIAGSPVIPGFDFEPKADLEQSPAWFLDATHSVPSWTPLFGWFWVNFCRHGTQYGAEVLSVPTVRGWDMRFMRGGSYMTMMPVESEAEIRQREVRFRDAIRPFVEDYDGLWKKCLTELMGLYEDLKRQDVDKMTNIEALAHFEQSVNVCRRMWELHFYLMYGTFTAYMLFENMCRELLGIDDTNPLFHKLISGFDNKVLQVDRRIWEFSKRAKEMGLASMIVESEPKDIAARLEASPKGREFMKAFRAFCNEDGWRMQRMAEINLPTWVEDPTPPLATVKQFLQKGGEFDLDRERAKLAREREAAEAQVLPKIGAEQKGWFTKLLRLAQRSGIFSEEHDHYYDLYTHALLRRSSLALGRRMAAAGCIDQAEDVFYLIPDEIRKVALSPGLFDLKPVAAARREQWNAWLKTPNPPAILRDGFGLDQAMGLLVKSADPIGLKVVVGSMPVPRPELKADLHGTCGSPGVAEGPARVILSEDQLAEVKPGDILVATSTSPSWTAVFSLIKGVVVDRGASLSHAAIVGREYGIPVLMNVFVGTEKIKTGQRIRVDANLGALYMLN